MATPQYRSVCDLLRDFPPASPAIAAQLADQNLECDLGLSAASAGKSTPVLDVVCGTVSELLPPGTKHIGEAICKAAGKGLIGTTTANGQ